MTENQLLSDRYRLRRLLAVGGMGEVWEATDELLARPVAVKLLRFEHISDETARRRFRAEARFAGSLQHSGIAQVYDYGEHGEKVFLVMELVSGEPLSDLLERRAPLSPDITLGIIAQAARALQAAHSAGIVHRDIKPGNLMVTDDDLIKITDFGIARDGTIQSSYTATGMVMGTAHYVSPEQATARPVTGASDLYSLGVVAYQCLTGELPFDGDTAVAVALQHVHDPPPPLPEEIPEPVRAFVERLLDKDPARRPGSAQEVAEIASSLRASLVFGSTGPHPSVSAPPTPAGGRPAVSPTGPTRQVDQPADDRWKTGGDLPAAQPPAAQPPAAQPNGAGETGPTRAQPAQPPTRVQSPAAAAEAASSSTSSSSRSPSGDRESWDGDGEFLDLYGPDAAASARDGERRRGSVLVLTLVGTAILVLGVIMLGSIWQGDGQARYVDDANPGVIPTQLSPESPFEEESSTPTPKKRKASPTITPSVTPTLRPPPPRPTPSKSKPRPKPTPTRSTPPEPSEPPTPTTTATAPEDGT